MNKKSFLKVALAATAALSLVACSKVPAGNVGVKVYLLGSEKGVDNEVLGPGRYWIGWNEDLFLFPTFTQNKVWEGKDGDPRAFTFQTSEGMVVGADLGLSYAVMPEKVSTVFAKYRRGIDEITDTYLLAMVKDALNNEASKIRVESVYGEGREVLLKNVEERVRKQVEAIGIKVERVYWIGQLQLPQEVNDKINAKVNADQITSQKQAEVAQKIADADSARAEAQGVADSILIKARAEAQANELIGKSITPELVRYKQIDRWDGVTPKITGGPVLPTFDVKEFAE